MTETAAVEAPAVWRRSRAVPAYLSWCMVVRNSKLDLLEAAIKSARERAPDAEIVVVETRGSNTEEIRALVERLGDVFESWAGPRGDWNAEMYAVDDMSAARQRSFELATGAWRGWLDDDDRIVGPVEARKLLELNGRWRPPAREGQCVYAPEEDGGVQPAGVASGEPAIGLEDLLRWTERNHPEVTCFWCPYLYMKDEEGNAVQWSERERIVRWDEPTRFRWAEPAHEILVPREGYLPPRVELPHLLWVHEKKWDAVAYEYSLKRHSAIILKQYDSGDVTFRRARYLAAWAGQMPSLGLAHRELEFLDRALEVAFTWLDRYRARIALGLYYAKRGLTWDAADHFSAAQSIAPALPDAWYASGQVALDREDWGRAVDHLRRGIACAITPESEVNPREHAVSWPSKLALALQGLARDAREIGAREATVAALAESRDLAFKVLGKPEVGKDALEANLLFCKAENLYFSEEAVVALHRTWQHLRRNDETQKALGVLALLPHDQQHHPLAVEMEAWARPIRRHVSNPAAYRDFYNADLETGWKPISAEHATFDRAHPRVQWAIRWIEKNAPTARVLDVGCCDGLAGLPLLLTCKDVGYHGVDVNAGALDNFVKLQRELQIADARVVLERGPLPKESDLFDVVLLGEIVEHVPDPVAWLGGIMLRHLKPGGAVLLTTPWGSFDEGHPPDKTGHGTPRDERGHLRAYSAWKLTGEIREAGGRVESIEHVRTASGGDAMCAVIRHEVWREETLTADPNGPKPLVVRVPVRDRPIAVAVAGALWDWNGSKVDREGIGASEEMIVRMGEKLALSRTYDVYGPTPEEEVHRGVGYFPRRAIRAIGKDDLIVVSRAPGYVRRIDEWTGRPEQEAVLWLQDTHYPDLTPEVARRYRSIVCVSDWHSELIARTTFGESWRQEVWPPSEGGTGRIRTIYNWVDRSHFQGGIDAGWHGIKQSRHFIYASSPDRGLLKLLELWPRVLDMYPDATLSVFYGWKGAARLGTGMDASWNQRYLKSRRRYEELRHQKGVVEVGMVDHYRVALEFQRATALLYPGDFHETFGTVAAKAGAAGCVPVVTCLAGLRESADVPHAQLIGFHSPDGKHLPGYDEAWLAGVRAAVEKTTEERQEMARRALDKFSWEAVEAAWREVLA